MYRSCSKTAGQGVAASNLCVNDRVLSCTNHLPSSLSCESVRRFRHGALRRAATCGRDGVRSVQGEAVSVPGAVATGSVPGAIATGSVKVRQFIALRIPHVLNRLRYTSLIPQIPQTPSFSPRRRVFKPTSILTHLSRSVRLECGQGSFRS